MQLITEKEIILWGNSNSWLSFKFEFDLKEIELENEILIFCLEMGLGPLA
jgi:hypothetical protein